MHDIVSARNAKAMMVLAMAIFGTLGTMTQFIDLPASVIVVFRGTVGAATILLLVYLTGSRLSKQDIYGNMFTLVCSGICLGLNWLFLFEAYKSIEVSVATVLNYMTPAMVILAAPVFLKTRLTPVKLGCALLALLGLVLVTGIVQDGIEGMNAYGVSCGVLAAVFYTAMVLFNKKLTSIGSYDRTVVQLGVAAVVVMVYSLLTVDFGELRFDAVSIVLLLVMGVVHTGIAFTLYFGSLAYLDASSAVIYGYIEPIIGLMLSVVVLGEDLGWIGWVGAALILGSTFAAEILERRKARASARDGRAGPCSYKIVLFFSCLAMSR